MNVLKKLFYRCYQGAFKLVIPFLPYRNPKKLKEASDMVLHLKEQKISKICIITDPIIMKMDVFVSLIQTFNQEGIEYTIYDETKPNPTIGMVEAARALYIKENCQAILAVGGGSAMDLAKVCGARIVKPKKSVEQMKGLLHIRKKLPPLFVIPTTSGTGSETTIAAVITNDETHQKYPINDFCLIPHYAILDPMYTISLPKHLTSTTGMDALTHAVEAFIGKSTTKKTRRMSIEAVKLIVHNIKKAYLEPENIEARRNMLLASHYAGIAFTISYVGYVHAVAHSLGGKYKIPHGLANAILLPHVLEVYGSKIHHKLAILSKESRIAEDTDSDAIAARKFISWIYEANQEMEIPKSIPQIQESDIPQMARYAIREANPLYPVPVLMDYEEIKTIYYSIRGSYERNH